MDLRVVIRKSVANFFSLIIILSFYLYLLFFVQKYLVEKYHWDEQTSLIILVLVIVLTIEPLRRFLFTIVDKVFYSNQKNTREEAGKFKIIFSSSLQFGQLIKKVKSELGSFLVVNNIQFVWHNKQSGNLENYFQDDKKITFGPTDHCFIICKSIRSHL